MNVHAHNADESVGWPSYVDFLSTFIFLLILFIGSLVFQVSGVIEQRTKTRRLKEISSMMGSSGVPNSVLQNKIFIPLERQVNFAPGKAILDEPAKEHLRLVALQITQACSDQHIRCRRIIVEGHADRTPFKNNPFGNWELSAYRAVQVLQFFYNCTTCGFEPKIRTLLVLSGQGDVDATGSIKGDAADRRVDVILDYGKGA